MTSPYIGPPLLIPGKSWPRAFRVGQPAYDAFPHKTWESLLVRSWRRMPQDLMTYHRVAGYLPLREAIAEYLATARGVRCTARQVIIVCGSQQGIDLTARVLLDPGERVWIEDPGYTGARGAFLAAGARLVPVPLDAEGMVVDLGKARDPDARIAFVTPSHQFPMGITMSLVRRISLLEWARTAGAWILEDDYDSEFRSHAIFAGCASCITNGRSCCWKVPGRNCTVCSMFSRTRPGCTSSAGFLTIAMIARLPTLRPALA